MSEQLREALEMLIPVVSNPSNYTAAARRDKLEKAQSALEQSRPHVGEISWEELERNQPSANAVSGMKPPAPVAEIQVESVLIAALKSADVYCSSKRKRYIESILKHFHRNNLQVVRK